VDAYIVGNLIVIVPVENGLKGGEGARPAPHDSRVLSDTGVPDVSLDVVGVADLVRRICARELDERVLNAEPEEHAGVVVVVSGLAAVLEYAGYVYTA